VAPTIASININSDGAPLTKYKSFSIWPVIGTITELNQSTREIFENIIIFGVLISRIKPIYNQFFETVFQELSELCDKTMKINGVWHVFLYLNFHYLKKYQFKDLNVYVRTQCLIADLPAKAALLNMKQYNGEFGCVACLNPGQAAGPGHRIYPFDKKVKLG